MSQVTARSSLVMFLNDGGLLKSMVVAPAPAREVRSACV